MSTETDGTGLLPYSSSKQPETRELRYDPKARKTYDPKTGDVIDPVTGDPTGEIRHPEDVEEPIPTTKQAIEKEILISTEFEGNKYALRTTPTQDGCKTALLMDGRELTSVDHKSPIYEIEDKRDNAFAKRIMIEFGKTRHEKYRKPIYDMVELAKSKKDEFNVAVQKMSESLTIDEDEVEAKNERIRLKKEKRIKYLYSVLANTTGKYTDTEIEEAKIELREKLLSSFWDIEGLNPKTGNPGHVSLKKLPVADYIHKVFNIVKYGGRLWWFDWARSFYTYDADNVFINKEVCDIMDAVGDGDFYKYNGNIISDKSQIIDKASNVNVCIENPFNKKSGYINARNGVLHLDYENKKVTLIGKRPDFKFSYCIDTVFDPDARDTAIYHMLVENLGPDQADRFIQMLAIAIRDTDPKLDPSKIAYIFIGPKNTGKNTVMRVASTFFGNAIVSTIPLLQIAQNKFVKPLLEGKVINLDDELPDNLPLTESREIKSLTGGKFHTLEPKNVKPYQGIITALMVFAGNQFPKCSISENDSAFWDRWEIFDFRNEQHNVDEEYLNGILTPENLSGLFNLVIEKLFYIHDHKIRRVHNGAETYRRWMYGSSTVYRFIQEMTSVSREEHTYVKHEFFDYYLDWCKVRGIPKEDILTKLYKFDDELKNIYKKVKETRPRIGDTRPYCYEMHRRYEPDNIYEPNGVSEPEPTSVEPVQEEYPEPHESTIRYFYIDEYGIEHSYDEYGNDHAESEPPKEIYEIDENGIPHLCEE